MTALALILHTLLSLAAGATVTGLIRLPLRLEERVLLTIVIAVAAPAMIAYVAATLIGLSVVTVLLAPLIVAALAAAAVALGAARPWLTWTESWHEAARRWRSAPRIGVTLFAVLTAGFFTWIFAKSLWFDGGALQSAYPTVWADWSQHLTTAATFAVAHNIPPVNPLFSGTPLLYPFMPDFHSAELMVLGMGPELALAIPGAVLATVICLLLVCIAERVGARPAAGAIAAVASVLGGGLGFLRLFGDACVYSVTGKSGTQNPAAYDLGNAAAQGCSLHQVASHPASWPTVIKDALLTTWQNQPRAYDGLLTDYHQLPVHNLQWYTPLTAWWLPQRSFLYGCAMALSVILLIAVLLQDGDRRDPWAWGIAAVTAGLLPLFHVHSLIALAVIVGVVALIRRQRWREWLLFAGVTAVVALPRLAQLSLSAHGSAAGGNQYPQLIPGWGYQFDPGAPHSGLVDSDTVSIGNALHSMGTALTLPFQRNWWEFWMVNLGIAVPLCAFVVLAVAARLIPDGTVQRIAARLLAPFPAQLLPWALGCTALFAVANVVVFQSWWWDNTKIFAYWYIGAGLLLGSLVVYLWERGSWAVLGAALVAMTIATGSLVVLRMTSFEDPASRTVVTGPFTLASRDDVTVAHAVALSTPGKAVFLTTGRPQDPLQTIAGRITTEGYFGWLWSYGTVIDDRGTPGGDGDLETIIRGCKTTAISDSSCPVSRLLRKYNIDYVEIDTRGDTNGFHDADSAWWEAQGLPVVASGGTITVYDVRHA